MERGRFSFVLLLLMMVHSAPLHAQPLAERDAYPVAVLECPAWEHSGSSSPQVLADAFRAGGFDVRLISPEELGDSERFHAGNCSLVVLPYGEFFPARARENFLRFLADGGDFVSMGGYAFQRLVIKAGEGWVSVPEFVQSQRTRFLDVGSEGDELFLAGDWYDGETTPNGETFRWTGKSAAVRIVPPTEVPWRIVVEGLVRDEVRELRREVWWQGKRIGLLDGQSLRRWELDMPPVVPAERPGGVLRFDCETWQPAHVYGTEDYRALGVAIDSIKVFAADESEPNVPSALGALMRSINTSQGPAQDFLEVRGEQLGVFDAGYRLEQAATARSPAGQSMLRRSIKVVGPFHGYAATGMIGSHWYCNSPRDEGRLIPLLEAYDRYDRFRGNLGAAILNYASEYRGSLWAFFGVENGDLFRRDIPGTLEALSDVASFFARGVFLHESRPEFACYYPEENYRILTNISNVSSVTRTVQLDFETYGDAPEPVDRESQRIMLAPHSVTEATFVSRVQKTGPDFYRVRVLLSVEGSRIDIQDSGFFVWRPEGFAASAFSVTWSDGRLGTNGVPLFLLGTQAFYPLYSAADRSPLRVLSDFSRMRDYGVHLARSFSWDWDKHHTRFQDALAAAAQRHGTVNLVEGISKGPTIDSAGLEEARSTARTVANRYRAVPGLIFDIRNEPAFSKEHLDGLLAAYASFVDAPSPEAVKRIPLRGKWDDLRLVQSHRFLTGVMREWLQTCADEIHQASPGRLATVGFLQFVNQQHVDRRIGIDHLDFANQHFYAGIEEIRRLSAEMVFMDMTYAGRPTSLGEFGSKTHPAFEKSGHNYDTEDEQLLRYAHAAHMGLGLGGLFVCNWHWRDPISCVFPYGLLHQDGAPKKTARLYRAMALLFSGFQPSGGVPEVNVLIPEAHRTGAAWGQITWATLGCIARLMDCQVPVSVIHESDLSLLPKGTRVIFWPVPYCPSDETYFRMVEFVRNGGNLYLSGDVSYDERTRQRTRTARLIELCGVEFVEERYPNIHVREAPPVRPVAATEEIRFTDGAWRPALVVQAARSTPLVVSETGDPLVLLHRLGKGRVLYNVEPAELWWKCDARPRGEDSELYRWFLRRCGIRGLPVEPKIPDFRAMRVPTRDRGEVYVFIDLAENRKTQTARLQGPRETFAFTLRDHFPGLIQLDRQGRPVAVEAGGEFRAGDAVVAEASAAFMLISLSGADIRESKMLALVPFARGPFVFHSDADWDEPVLQVGEVEDGRWKAFEQISLHPDTTGAFEFQVHSLQELEILIICEQGREAECGARVAKRLTKPWQVN